MSLPNPHTALPAEPSMIAGSVLPIQRAEELLATLPGVISARIVASPNGAVDEIHILTTTEVTPKQTVRNVESALIAHLGMHVSHKKISVATSEDDGRSASPPARRRKPLATPAPAAATPHRPEASGRDIGHLVPCAARHPQPSSTRRNRAQTGRRIYFEDSKSAGPGPRRNLQGDATERRQSFVGEAEGIENERLRIELAARAALAAIGWPRATSGFWRSRGAGWSKRSISKFVFVGVTTKHGRESALMTGSAEIRESPETASVLAVLDATNRWLDR